MTFVPHSGSVAHVEPTLLQQAVVERGFRDGREHSAHREGDSRLLDEFDLAVEDAGVVVVEAHDHAAPDLHSEVLDAMNFLDQSAAISYVLILLGLAQ